MGKTLVAYFSRTGTTRKLAEQIHSMIPESDLFEIRTIKSYPKNYLAAVIAAKKELKSGEKPKLSVHMDNMGDYDKIVVGYPIWCGTMPMALTTFFEEYDFSDKTIAPFATYGGTGVEKSEADIKKIWPQSHFIKGFGYGAFSKGNVDEWIDTLKKHASPK